MPRKIVLFLLLVCFILAARKSHRTRRTPNKHKITTCQSTGQGDVPQANSLNSYNNQNQQIAVSKQISFGQPQYFSYNIKKIFLTSFFYLLAGIGVLAICYCVLRKLYESEVNELCKNHQIRRLERKVQKQELEDIANGVRTMKRPQEMRCKLKHKNQYL